MIRRHRTPQFHPYMVKLNPETAETLIGEIIARADWLQDEIGTINASQSALQLRNLAAQLQQENKRYRKLLQNSL